MTAPDAKEIAREAIVAWTAVSNDLGSISEGMPALTALAAELAAPNFVCVLAPMPPTPEVVYPGFEGIADAWREYGAAFDDVRAELEEVRESEDHLVLLVVQIATTKHDGVEISQPSAIVLAFEEGRLARLEFHIDRGHALRGAGLEP